MSKTQTKAELEILVQQLITARDSILEDLKKEVAAHNHTKEILAEVVEERDGLSQYAEQIFTPEETKESTLKKLAVMLSQNVQIGNLGSRGCLLADLTQRAWKATTVAQIHMRVENNQLCISIDRDLYLADKKKWLFAFGLLRGAVEETCLQYTYNNGLQFISVRKQERRAA